MSAAPEMPKGHGAILTTKDIATVHGWHGSLLNNGLDVNVGQFGATNFCVTPAVSGSQVYTGASLGV